MTASTRGRIFRGLLRRHRETLTYEDVGLPPRHARSSGTAKLPQGAVDLAVDLGAGVYQKYESGGLRPKMEVFVRLTRKLGFTDHHRRIAQLDLFGTEPPPPSGPVSPHWQRVVDGTQEVAFVMTAAGDLVVANTAAASMFPEGQVPTNWWRWSLLSSEAREAVLTDWATAWAPGLLADFTLACVRHPKDDRLRGIWTDIKRDPVARTVTDAERGVGDRLLPLIHARYGRGTVHTLLSASTGVTLVMLLFNDISVDLSCAEPPNEEDTKRGSRRSACAD